MSYLIAIGVSFLAFGLFLVLTAVEGKTGKRMLRGTRENFDAKVARVAYIIRHVDWGAFVTHTAKALAERIAHDVVHGVLLAVRSTERVLTRLIRVLRERVALRTTPSERTEGLSLRERVAKFRKTRPKNVSTPGASSDTMVQ